MNKQMKIFDNNQSIDKASIKGTKIILSETGTGKVLFRGSNKVIVSGSEFNALKDFNFDPTWSASGQAGFLSNIPNYDSGLARVTEDYTVAHTLDTPGGKKVLTTGILAPFAGCDVTTDNPLHEIYKYFTRRAYLFCVGIDGCGIENSRVFKVSTTKWIAPYTYAAYDPGTGQIDTSVTNCLIPFKSRVVDNSYSTDLTTDERAKYFGRSKVGSTISYYFKCFNAAPTLYRRYADNSGLLSSVTDVWLDPRKSDAEIVVELKMNIDITDCREYFNQTVGSNSSRVNTISLLTAVPYLGTDPYGADTSTDRLFYQDIRPLTKFNFPNESLINSAKGIDITYYLYY